MPLSEQTQKELLARLRRIEGQARGVQRMVEEGRGCPEVIGQLAAIRAALYSASLFLLKNYAKECWANGADKDSAQESLQQLMELMLRSSH